MADRKPARQALSCWIVAGVAASAVGACSGRPKVAPPAAAAPAPAPVVAPGPAEEPPAERTTASGVRVWTVGGDGFWIDVPVALGPVDSPGAIAASARGTADALFPSVPGAASVRVGISVSHNTAYDVAPGAPLRDEAAHARRPSSTFADTPRERVTPRRLEVPGAADAYLTVAEFEGKRPPGERAVSLDLHAVPQSGWGPWLVRAYAIGPERHDLLARDGALVELLDQLVRSFSLAERPVARLRPPPPGSAVPEVAPLRIDTPGEGATGAYSERDAVRLAMKAMAEGDPDAWARVVVYGNYSAYARAYDESRLATMRLARAVRQRPVPGISSWDVSRAVESLQRAEEALRQIDRLPRPPREGERGDDGATGGPTRLIERAGRFYLARHNPGGGASDDDDGLNPYVLGSRAWAVAYNEAAARHLAGQFREVRELEAFIEKRRHELLPPQPDHQQETAE